MTRPASRERVQSVSTLLMRIAGSFNTTNNTPNGFRINYADRWRHIKAPLTYQEVLPQGDIYTTMARTQGKVYKALLTTMKRYVKYIALEKERVRCAFLIIPYLFHKSILTLASEVLWQAPHRWSLTSEAIPLIIQVSESEAGPPWVHITRLTKLRFITTVSLLFHIFVMILSIHFISKFL